MIYNSIIISNFSLVRFIGFLVSLGFLRRSCVDTLLLSVLDLLVIIGFSILILGSNQLLRHVVFVSFLFGKVDIWELLVISFQHVFQQLVEKSSLIIDTGQIFELSESNDSRAKCCTRRLHIRLRQLLLCTFWVFELMSYLLSGLLILQDKLIQFFNALALKLNLKYLSWIYFGIAASSLIETKEATAVSVSRNSWQM